jgi:PIN domain nuclease of toxin-antitoxin system
VTAVLLDTCAVIWVFENQPIDDKARAAIVAAEKTNEVLISPVTAWEIGLLSRPRGSKPAKMQFKPNARTFVMQAFSWPAVQVVPLTPDIAFEASYLPAEFQQDPADRFLIATARALDVPIVTRDKDMQAYAKAGHVKLIVC